MRLAGSAFNAIGVVGLLLYLTYDRHDHNVNFQRVDARISTINEKCDAIRGWLVIQAQTTGSAASLMTCAGAEDLHRTSWRRYAVHTNEVHVVYISPVDGATHTSSLSAFPEGQVLRAGDVVPILASKTEADKTRWEHPPCRIIAFGMSWACA